MIKNCHITIIKSKRRNRIRHMYSHTMAVPRSQSPLKGRHSIIIQNKITMANNNLMSNTTILKSVTKEANTKAETPKC